LNKSHWFTITTTKDHTVEMCGPMNGNLHYYREEFEDTKGVIRIRKSKDRQYNSQKGSLHRIGK